MFDAFPGHFNAAQTKQLLAPIRPSRVLKDGKGNSHVSQQDITAHLIRVFGFGNFTTDLLTVECIFEQPHAENEKEPWKRRYSVAYRATMRVTIYDEDHNYVAHYEDASVGDAQNLVRHEAHDLAMKSAISLAKKRCCINLGDQFGLSLYNKGQMEALVRGTLVLPPKPEGEDEAPVDVQEGVPQQHSMGIDETEKVSEPTDEQAAALEKSLGATTVAVEEPTDEDMAAVARGVEA
jgi:recombination DNA repair RAD52 pathway protein